MSARKADIIGCIGRKTSGKTTEMLSRLVDYPRHLRVSPTAQPDFKAGCHHVETVAELAHIAKNFDPAKPCRLYFDGERGMIKAKVLDIAAKFCVATGFALAVDELQTYLPKQNSYEFPIEQLINQNRHIGGADRQNPTGVAWLYTATSDTDISPALRVQTDIRVYFQGFDGTYKDRLNKTFGAEMTNQLLNAPKYSKLILDVNSGTSFVPFEPKAAPEPVKKRPRGRPKKVSS